MVISDLLDERKACVVVEVVPREGEMVVEGSSRGFSYVKAVCVHAKVGWGFGFTDILGVRAP